MATMTEPRQQPKIHQNQCFIGGQWQPAVSGKTFETINPATEEVITHVAEGDEADVDLAVTAARKALDHGPWSRMDARDRGRLMYKLADLIEEEIDELAALESLDNGKPIREARGGDLPFVLDVLRYYAGYADKIHGQTIPVRGEYFCYTRREPVGVVGQIIPWNFPMLMAAWKWGPALAAGCTIVMKPAEQTPLSCLRMARLAQKAGIPDGVINVVPGYGPTAGGAIVKHRGVDKVAFTGEYKTAQIIMREAATTLKRLTFELGGKSPNIVFADADLDAAAAGSHLGLYLNQGQCCCAGSRLFVEEKAHDKLVEKLVAMNKSRKLGEPLDPETEQAAPPPPPPPRGGGGGGRLGLWPWGGCVSGAAAGLQRLWPGWGWQQGGRKGKSTRPSSTRSCTTSTSARTKGRSASAAASDSATAASSSSRRYSTASTTT